MQQVARHHLRIAAPIGIKSQLLNWADTHETAMYLDSNPGDSTWDCLVALGCEQLIAAQAGTAFQDLSRFFQGSEIRDWLFGFFAYDLKNETERLTSQHPDGIGLPDLFFFQPRTVVGVQGEILSIWTLEPEPNTVLQAITAPRAANLPSSQKGIQLQPRISKTDYCDTVARIREHIIEGDLYEMNFCQEFYADAVQISPHTTFQDLNALSKAPFSAYMKYDGRYLMCASPERFLKKTGDLLVSQPIKGTRKRHSDPLLDAALKDDLIQSEKDRAENVMIVDLVRNDLAKVCIPGSVQVPELFGIHTFETVHQMISTVTGRLRPGASGLDAIKGAFPMGSMTGAPKVMAMELIERYETTKRGLYSGAIGYFDPNGDFDFNVVIRSLLYNSHSQYLSCQVGGAIVYDSVAEQEYEECFVKISAIQQVLEGND